MNKEKNNSTTGVGVGSLFSALTREIIPVSKSSIENLKKVMDNKSMKIMGKTLQKEATNTAVDETLKFLNQKNIKKTKKKQLKRAAKNILLAAKNKKPSKLSQPKKQQKNKLSSAKKRKLKQNKGPRKKKSLIDDDDY